MIKTAFGISSNKPTIIAFFVPNDASYKKYGRAANNLTRDCLEYNQQYYIEELSRDTLPDKPTNISWRNWVCRYKPTFILKWLNTLEGPVMYLDVDTEILKKPRWKSINRGVIAVGHHKNHLSRGFSADVSGIFVRNNARARKFLHAWKLKCDNIHLNTADHIHFCSTAMEFNRTIPGYVRRFGGNIVSKRYKDKPTFKHS